MFAYSLAVVSLLGFVVSILIHVETLFGYANPISSLISLLLLIFGMLLGLPGTLFIFPSSPSIPNSWVRRMGHNFWRPIPKKGIYLIRSTMIYGVGVFLATMLLGGGSKELPELPAVRVVTAIAMAFFSLHWMSYWYHSPESYREGALSIFKSKKHLKRHQKHE